MSGILDPQDAMIPSRKLNLVNDPSPGSIVSTANVSGSIIQYFAGQVGKRLVCTTATALKLSDTAIGTLYEGIYQYVQFKSGVTAPARGALCYWDDYANYIVTSVPGASVAAAIGDNSGLFAGVYLNTATAGNYGYIQIAGKASVLFKSTITASTTTSAGDLVVVDGTTSARGDILSKVSPTPIGVVKLIMGVALNTPTNNAISLVDLWNLRQVMGGFGGF